MRLALIDASIDRVFVQSHVVLTSALAEIFLRKMHRQGYIRYQSGADAFLTAEDDEKNGGTPEGQKPLKEADEKIKNRLNKLCDLVLFRYGSTGVQEAINKAVDLVGLVPAYRVNNLNNFSIDKCVQYRNANQS